MIFEVIYVNLICIYLKIHPMKITRTILIVLSFYIHSSAQAQLASGSTAPNFTLTDIDGNTHQLYDYLDQGKAVLLDFFAVWCGPCQNHAPSLDAAYQQFGPSGDNSMVFLALEADDATSDAQCDSYGGFQWSSVLSYPIINNTGYVPSEYAVTYYPTIYVVCPDRIITEVGQVNASTIASFVDANCDLVVYQNDLQVQNVNTNIDNCNGEVNPVVEIKNVGSGSINNPVVDLYLDDELIETVSWLGNISSYESVLLEFASLNSISAGSHTFEAVVIGSDDNSANNSMSVDFSINQFTSNLIALDITFDNYPSETSWELLNSSGEVLYNGSGYSNANGSISESFELVAGDCYSFSIFDTYGDGICCSYGNGSYSLSADGLVISGGNFASSEHFNFYVGSAASVLSQQIELPVGWSMFSTYMQAENMDLMALLSGVQTQIVIAKDYMGSAYLPDWDYNGIGDVQYEQGYQIKTTEACSFIIAGTYLEPEENPVGLAAGWNIISYLRVEPAAADLVFSELNAAGNIVIAKDASGAAYLPAWDFNGIGDLEPGKGYQLKTNLAGELLYLPNSQQYE